MAGWAQTGTIGVDATLGVRDRLAAQRPAISAARLALGDR
jgi:hypothetical protein